eukprot:gene18977-25554_t
MKMPRTRTLVQVVDSSADDPGLAHIQEPEHHLGVVLARDLDLDLGQVGAPALGLELAHGQVQALELGTLSHMRAYYANNSNFRGSINAILHISSTSSSDNSNDMGPTSSHQQTSQRPLADITAATSEHQRPTSNQPAVNSDQQQPSHP